MKTSQPKRDTFVTVTDLKKLYVERDLVFTWMITYRIEIGSTFLKLDAGRSEERFETLDN